MTHFRAERAARWFAGVLLALCCCGCGSEDPVTSDPASGESADPVSAPGQITIASFNVKLFAVGSRNETHIRQMAELFKQFDLIAIQGVRDFETVDRTLTLLWDQGYNFVAAASELVGEDVPEQFIFFWLNDKVEMRGIEKTWQDPEGRFVYPPYIGFFKADGFDFVLVSVRLVSGQTEVAFLDAVYQSVLADRAGEQDVILAGDFILPPEDLRFDGLREHLTPLFSGEIRTTVTESALSDNIWIQPQHTAEYTGAFGVDRFDQRVFGNNDQEAETAVSDHRPVWAKFSTVGPDDD